MYSAKVTTLLTGVDDGIPGDFTHFHRGPRGGDGKPSSKTFTLKTCFQGGRWYVLVCPGKPKMYFLCCCYFLCWFDLCCPRKKSRFPTCLSILNSIWMCLELDIKPSILWWYGDMMGYRTRPRDICVSKMGMLPPAIFQWQPMDSELILHYTIDELNFWGCPEKDAVISFQEVASMMVFHIYSQFQVSNFSILGLFLMVATRKWTWRTVEPQKKARWHAQQFRQHFVISCHFMIWRFPKS